MVYLTLRNTPLTYLSLILVSLMLSACQSNPISNNPTITATPMVNTNLPNANLPNRFEINGKIGVTTPQQAGSAFYTWSQQDNVFAIDLSGVLGVGQTHITYNGNIASITSEKINNTTHTLTARSPEELLQQVANWQAPISQLPYWIMGKYAPSDGNNQLDTLQRLSIAHNSDWTANFSYEPTQKLPNKITMQKATGEKVILTINHLK